MILICFSYLRMLSTDLSDIKLPCKLQKLFHLQSVAIVLFIAILKFFVPLKKVFWAPRARKNSKAQFLWWKLLEIKNSKTPLIALAIQLAYYCNIVQRSSTEQYISNQQWIQTNCQSYSPGFQMKSPIFFSCSNKSIRENEKVKFHLWFSGFMAFATITKILFNWTEKSYTWILESCKIWNEKLLEILPISVFL